MAVRSSGPNEDYRGFASRLHAEFGAGFEHPSKSKFIGPGVPFFQAVLDSIDDQDIGYLRLVAHPGPSPHWHSVDVFEPRLDRYYPLQASESLEAGAALVIEQALYARLPILSVTRRGERYDFIGKTGVIASVAPTAFAGPPRFLVERVLTGLKGVRYCDSARLAKRLNSIPGLEMLHGDDPRSDAGARYEYPIYPTAANIAAALKRGFARYLGLDLKLSRVQEATAHAVGISNWSTLVALEGRCNHAFVPLVLLENEHASHRQRQFFRDGASAIAGLAEMTRRLTPRPDRLGVSHIRSLCITGDRSPSSADGNPSLELYTLPDDVASNESLQLAISVLRDGVDIASFFAVKANGREPLVPIDKARGNKPSDVLYLGNRVFTRSTSNDKEYVMMELLNDDNERVGQALDSLALYKAHIAFDAGKPVLTENYNRETWLSLHDFAGDEIRALLEFLGPRFSNEFETRFFSLSAGA